MTCNVWASTKISKLQPAGQTQTTIDFCKYPHIETPLFPFVYASSMAIFLMQWQTWVDMTEIMWFVKLKMFTILSFPGTFCPAPLNTALNSESLVCTCVLLICLFQRHRKVIENGVHLSCLSHLMVALVSTISCEIQ